MADSKLFIGRTEPAHWIGVVHDDAVDYRLDPMRALNRGRQQAWLHAAHELVGARASPHLVVNLRQVNGINQRSHPRYLRNHRV